MALLVGPRFGSVKQGIDITIDNTNIGAAFFSQNGALTGTVRNSIVRSGSGAATISRAGSGTNGVMFVGTNGMMFADYGSYKLFPQEEFADFDPPEKTIPDSIGHHSEWIRACMEGTPTTCNFTYSGALTETVQLGSVAFRTGEALEWDATNLRATNTDAAAKFVSKEYRAGWEVT